MFMPSERVRKAMYSENASVWVVPTQGGVGGLAMLVKAPTASLKAMIKGCHFDVAFGFKNNILCYSLSILDTSDAPLLISGYIINEEEVLATCKLIEEKKAIIYLFNELDFCMGWSKFSIALDKNDISQAPFKKPGTLYKGEINNECKHALDCICFSRGQTDTQPNAELIDLHIVTFDIEKWNINNNTVIGLHESNSIILDDINEGEMLERAVWSSLESVFPLTIYKSPKIKIGDKKREFTDVLAFDELGCILIESKDLSVIKSGFERSSERRVKGVQKQAITAIGQLVGAFNALNRGEVISDTSDKELDIEREGPHHCIVLITEISHLGDWTRVTNELISAFKQTRSFFHLIDLRELVTLLKISRGDSKKLRINLVNRFLFFWEKNSVHIRSR